VAAAAQLLQSIAHSPFPRVSTPQTYLLLGRSSPTDRRRSSRRTPRGRRAHPLNNVVNRNLLQQLGKQGWPESLHIDVGSLHQGRDLILLRPHSAKKKPMKALVSPSVVTTSASRLDMAYSHRSTSDSAHLPSNSMRPNHKALTLPQYAQQRKTAFTSKIMHPRTSMHP